MGGIERKGQREVYAVMAVNFSDPVHGLCSPCQLASPSSPASCSVHARHSGKHSGTAISVRHPHDENAEITALQLSAIVQLGCRASQAAFTRQRSRHC